MTKWKLLVISNALQVQSSRHSLEIANHAVWKYDTKSTPGTAVSNSCLLFQIYCLPKQIKQYCQIFFVHVMFSVNQYWQRSYLPPLLKISNVYFCVMYLLCWSVWFLSGFLVILTRNPDWGGNWTVQGVRKSPSNHSKCPLCPSDVLGGGGGRGGCCRPRIMGQGPGDKGVTYY